MLEPDAARRAALVAAGVAAHNGTASAMVDATGTWTTSLAMEDVGGFGMQGAAAGPPIPSGDVPFLEFMQATGGVAVWNATTRDTAIGPGVGLWSADPGTWVANELGLVGPTQFTAGTRSFVGTITLPGQMAA